MKPACPLCVAGSTAAWPGLPRSRAALSGNCLRLCFPRPHLQASARDSSPLFISNAHRRNHYSRGGGGHARVCSHRGTPGPPTPRRPERKVHTDDASRHGGASLPGTAPRALGLRKVFNPHPIQKNDCWDEIHKSRVYCHNRRVYLAPLPGSFVSLSVFNQKFYYLFKN